MKNNGNEKNKNKIIQAKLEWITRKWWFYLILIVLSFLLPTVSSISFNISELYNVMLTVFSTSLGPYLLIEPVFHIIPLALIIALIFFKNKIGRIFNAYVAINYFIIAFVQNITLTEKYGLVFMMSNFTLFIMVGIFWILGTIFYKDDFSHITKNKWKYWTIPLAILAFWAPYNFVTILPDFNPVYFLFSESGLAFCFITPLYLTILLLYHPNINVISFRFTSFIGVFIGILGIFVFSTNLGLLWWMLILHVPLISISIYCFMISFKK